MTFRIVYGFLLGLFVATALVVLTGCEEVNRPKYDQAQKAKEAAASINFTENAEIDNIKKRLQLTANPAAIGFIILLNEAGQPIFYTSVKGKITSGGKRLTEPDRAGAFGAGQNNVVRAAPSDEGTWGSSSPYIFFWTVDDQYIQWSGHYLYSDKPFRLKIDPLVVAGIK